MSEENSITATGDYWSTDDTLGALTVDALEPAHFDLQRDGLAKARAVGDLALAATVDA